MEKMIIPKTMANVDYRQFKDMLLKKLLVRGEEKYQYSLEYRNGILQIVELNFKPNTKTTMALPIPVYNEFVEEIAKRITRQGIKANDLMGIFADIYERYRRNYLGEIEPLKPSSYARYSSILYLLWKATDGNLGLKAELSQQHTVKTVTQEGNKTIIDSDVVSRGYFIKPTNVPIVRFIDKQQKSLLGWSK